MRQLALCLALVPALLLVLPAPVHAGDDDEAARLERRVEMLIDLVAELRAEVLMLRERVAKLEAEARTPATVILEDVTEDVPATPKVESLPATPIVPHPVVVWPAIGGVYTLDKEASMEAVLANQLEGIEDEEMAEMIRQGIASEFEGISITLRIEENGTFFVRVEHADMEEEPDGTARGTWKRDETVIGTRQRLLLVTTHEDGEESGSPTELVGTWEGGRLTLEEDDAGTSGYVMIFKRK